MTRIFFACDVHGSEIVWRKFLKMSEYHKADVIMMLGDLTGKVIVPIVKIGENKWSVLKVPYVGLVKQVAPRRWQVVVDVEVRYSS